MIFDGFSEILPHICRVGRQNWNNHGSGYVMDQEQDNNRNKTRLNAGQVQEPKAVARSASLHDQLEAEDEEDLLQLVQDEDVVSVAKESQQPQQLQQKPQLPQKLARDECKEEKEQVNVAAPTPSEFADNQYWKPSYSFLEFDLDRELENSNNHSSVQKEKDVKDEKETDTKFVDSKYWKPTYMANPEDLEDL